MSLTNPTIGVAIQAHEKGIDRGVILALLGHHSVKITLDGDGGASHEPTDHSDPDSLVRIVRRTLPLRTTRGILIDKDDQFVSELLTHVGGTFSELDGAPIYVYGGRTYHVFYPMTKLDERKR